MSDNLFQKNGYLFVPQLIDTSVYFNMMKKLVEVGRGVVDQQQVPGAIHFYKEPFFEKLMVHLLPQIELHTSYQLYKTYSFARQYKIGDELKPHKDRKACEITVSLALGGDVDQWPIWVEDRLKKPRFFILKAGDALIFKGIELKHWREENKFGQCSQVFFHYVDKNGPYANEKDDLNNKGHHLY